MAGQSGRRIPVLTTAFAVQKRYRTDAADSLAAAIGFFGFLSLFPLILLAVSVAGYVLQDPADHLAVAEVITDAIPGFEATLASGDDSTAVADLVQGAVEQRGTIGMLGLVLALVAGLRVVGAAMAATRVVFRGELLGGLGTRVRQLAAMAGLGVLALAAAGASSVAGVGLSWLPSIVTVPLSVAVTLALDFALFLGAYTLLAPTAVLGVRERIPGAVLGAVGWTALKVLGAAYVSSQVTSANATYGALGGVIGLLLLLYLAGRLYLYGAELSAVLSERRRGQLWADASSTLTLAARTPAGPDGPAHRTRDDADAGRIGEAGDGDARATAPRRRRRLLVTAAAVLVALRRVRARRG